FTKVGPRTGEWVGIDSSTAAITGLPPVSGGSQEVHASAPDGSGGFYIGGDFTHVGGLARHGLAHVLADRSVDPNFDPRPDGEVDAPAVSGSTVYAGGFFTQIGGQPRDEIAALDATIGTATSWNPHVNAVSPRGHAVWTLAVSGSVVYAGGYFQDIGGKDRNCIAAIDRTTGAATSWNANAASNCRVRTLTLGPSGGTLYAGGFFTQIGGQARNNIGALDAATGAATGWNPTANGDTYDAVSDLRVSGSTVYAGGKFTFIGGQPRNHIAALDATTGTATSWNPDSGGPVDALAVSRSTPARPARPAGPSPRPAARPATASPPSTRRPAPRRDGPRA